MARPKDLARRQLISASEKGRITLVLGAGVSIPRGIPNWNDLAKLVWKDVFKGEPSPWARQSKGSSPKELPQFLPIIFERAYHKLGDDARFFEVLKKHLYAEARFPLEDPAFRRSKEALAVLARLIVAEYKRGPRRRIETIITFNADDFIEQAISRVAGRGNSSLPPSIAGSVARSTHRLLPATAVPIYHVHGFLPSDLFRSQRGPERMLVFSDLQYWSTSATAFSFANRIVNTALSESVCVFIGLSMKDINLLRWLALRTLDRDSDQFDFERTRLLKWIAERSEGADSDLLTMVEDFLRAGRRMPSVTLDKHFRRHFWIRPPATDPGGFLTDFLYHRGIQAVDIDGWNDSSFQKLISGCFPKKALNGSRGRGPTEESS